MSLHCSYWMQLMENWQAFHNVPGYQLTQCHLQNVRTIPRQNEAYIMHIYTFINLSLARQWPPTYIIFQNCLNWRNLGFVSGEGLWIFRERCCVRPDLFKNCAQQAVVSMAAWVEMAKRSTCDKNERKKTWRQRQLWFYFSQFILPWDHR